jgi:hypothetical protein
MGDMNQMMAGIMVLIGAMALYYAITGRGKVFENDYPKGMKEEANIMLRKFLWIVYAWAYYIGLVVLPLIIVYYIIFRRKFSKYLKK